MLALLVAARVIPLQLDAGFVDFDVAPERVAVLAKVQADTPATVGVPYGAAIWEQPFDPSDNLPFGVSFDGLLDAGETLVDIERVALSSAAAALGLTIDTSTGHAPAIDANGARQIQLWLSVASGSQALSAYDAAGVRFPIAFKVKTSKGKRFDRSAVLTVRQL